MGIPKSVQDTIAALRQERVPIADRLDAIDLAIDNLNRVYGVHGEQPALVERRREKRPPVRRGEDSDGSGSEAAQRRAAILTLIERAEHGLTAKDLRKATPKLGDRDRSNALTVLRVKGEIKRAGNAWVKAA